MNESKGDIVKLLQSGDKSDQDVAFKFLYDEYFGLVKKFVSSNEGTIEDASDVFQDTLVAIFNNFNKPGYSISVGLKTYVYAIARNIWYKRLKRAKPEFQLPENFEELKVAESELEILETKEKYAHLHHLLDEIGEDCKNILLLFYFESKSIREITEKLQHANENLTKNRKSRCLKKLKDIAGDFLKVFGTK